MKGNKSETAAGGFRLTGRKGNCEYGEIPGLWWMVGKSLSVEDLENVLDTLWLRMTLEYLIFLRQDNRLDDPFRSLPLLCFYVVILNSDKKVKIPFFSIWKVFWEKKKPTQNLLRNAGMFCFDIFSQNKMLADSQIKIFNFGVLN